jgi:hypothetical protein
VRDSLLLWLANSVVLALLWPTRVLAHMQGGEVAGLLSGLRQYCDPNG